MDDLLNSAPCGFLCFADDGTILQINATLGDWLGYHPEELIGRSLDSILSVGGRIFHQTHIFPLLKLHGRAEEIYFSLKMRSGQALPVLTNAVRHERAGAFVSDCVFLPMHQRRQYEDELLQARKVADEANLAKARFLSTMSHELRTPMNAILGFGQLLEMEELTPLQAESVGYILQSGRHLLELINEVLDISRIEAGKLDLAIAPVSTLETMHEAFEMARPLANAAGITLTAPSGFDDGYVLADPVRLRQVLLNLLANGIKYNRPNGSVILGCELRSHKTSSTDGDSKDEQRLRFIVRDTGPGIPADEQDKLFVPFERLGAEAGQIEGTGLGLALCKQLSEAMGGEVGLQSTVGEGSCFWIELPVALAPAQNLIHSTNGDEADTAQKAVAPTSLLLHIEDDPSNIKLVQRLLARRPAVRLLPATTGEVGLQLARAHKPNLILLDLQLPDMMGDAVLQQLQEDENTHHIPVVMLSADATPHQVERLLKAGARDYLTKPFEISKLLSVLDALIEESLSASGKTR